MDKKNINKLNLTEFLFLSDNNLHNVKKMDSVTQDKIKDIIRNKITLMLYTKLNIQEIQSLSNEDIEYMLKEFKLI